MARSAGDPFQQAKALYGQTLTPPLTQQIRNFLETFVVNPGGPLPGDVAEGWSVSANILVCDCLNRWHDAGQPELDGAALASAYVLTGQPQEAQCELQKFDQQSPGHTTLAEIEQLERRSPNESLFVVTGRRNFRQGLRLAGRT